MHGIDKVILFTLGAFDTRTHAHTHARTHTHTHAHTHTQVSISLEEGVGISLINSLPEELLFASLKGLRADASLVSLSHKFSLSVQDVQVSVGDS